MLKNTKKNITITGESVITVTEDGAEKEVAVKGFSASIDSGNPGNMNISEWFVSEAAKDLYKSNRTACRADRAAFEDMAYTVQDGLIAELTAE